MTVYFKKNYFAPKLMPKRWNSILEYGINVSEGNFRNSMPKAWNVHIFIRIIHFQQHLFYCKNYGVPS